MPAFWGVVPGGKRMKEWAVSESVPPTSESWYGGRCESRTQTTLFRPRLGCMLQANSRSCRVTSRRPIESARKRSSRSKPEVAGVGKVRVAWGNRRELCGDGSNEESQADTLDVVARMRDQEIYAGWPNGLCA